MQSTQESVVKQEKTPPTFKNPHQLQGLYQRKKRREEQNENALTASFLVVDEDTDFDLKSNDNEYHLKNVRMKF
jgi:hypothetical protein